ncbi:MAG: FtsQ-type POTRA domain-containing protein [Deltaproteobacteria bacterium]|nr:FtsQ-type POTRA domain-containing protein [Deltaproteobacteria bacterium]
MSKLPSLGWLIKEAFKLILVGTLSFIVLAVLTVGSIVGYMYVNESDYFMIKPQSILVTGLSKLARTEILEAAGLDISVNSLTLDTKTVIKNIKALPWVENAELSQTLPNGLSLKVTEYKPKAIVSSQYLYYINENGLPFKKLDPLEISDLPIISGFTFEELSDSGPLVHDALAEIFSLIKVLDSRKDDYKTSNVSEFHYDRDRGLTLYLKKSGLKIKVGLGDYPLKFWRLAKVTAHLKEEGLYENLDYLILDYPERVTGSYGPGALQTARRGS